MSPANDSKRTLLSALFSAALAMALCGPVLAQSSAEEEPIEPITIDDHYSTEEGVAPEEEFEDLVFDAGSGSYRLVEDDSGDDWVEPPSQGEQDLAELKRLFELYRDALQNKNYVEADTLAKRVVELSIQINGLDSHDSAKAITNLGIAQHNNKDYDAALLNFAASIAIVERIDDRLSLALVNPLQGLAATQAATGRPDLARSTYQRAVHVSHVNEGPHNPNQVDTLESMAELYISMGEVKDANSIQENIYVIQSRNIDPTSLDIIPALEKRANWQHRLLRYNSERLTWRQIINVLEKHHGKRSLTLIEPLQQLGRSYLFVNPSEYEFQTDVSTASGESYLRRANRIADDSPDAGWALVEDTLLSLGDYYILSGRPNRAAKIYTEAWDLLTNGETDPETDSAAVVVADDSQGERLRTRAEHLQKPNILQRVYPPKYYNSLRENDGQPPPENFETGTITFGYTIGPNGRIDNLIHLETQPPEIKGFEEPVGRSLRRLIYRPRLVDGRMVSTAENIYTHDFFYRPTDLIDAPTDEMDVPGNEQSDGAAENVEDEATLR